MAPQAEFAIGLVCRFSLAAILAQSAWHALRAPAEHAAVVANYDLVPNWMVPLAAWGLPVLSGVAAFMLAVAATAHIGAALGLALMLLFTAAIFINVRRGRVHIDCGCGGARGQAISGGLVARNLVVIGLACVALVSPAAGLIDAATVIGGFGGAASVAALYFAASQLLANQTAVRA